MCAKSKMEKIPYSLKPARHSSYLIAAVVLIWVLSTCKSPKKTTTTGPKNNKEAKKDPKTKKEQKTKDGEKLKVEIPALSEEDSLDLKIGQMILVGIKDLKSASKKDSVVSEIAKNKVGSIILFEKNISNTNSYVTLKNCIDSLQRYAKIPLFVSIDEEGGQVHRLKEKYGFVKVPSAMHLGKIDNADSSTFYYERLAAQLHNLGINMNFAPSVDMGVNTKNPVIYKMWRSYSPDPNLVTKHAALCVEAHQKHKVATVLKHFPGHGSSLTDSHLGLTNVTKTWTAKELLPFYNLIRSNTLDAIMTAHIVNCKLDSSCLPATLSKKIITGLLRDSLGYSGLIVSDDMQMYAISKNYGLERAINLCINAGVDILLLGNNVIATQQVSATQLHSIIKKQVKEGKISKARISESYRRIMELKRKVGLVE